MGLAAAAAIGAVGAIGGAVISNKGASKAAQATQAAADQSAQVQREIYGQNAAALAPWQQSGLQANSAINALLGLGGPSNAMGGATIGQPTAQPVQQAPYTSSPTDPLMVRLMRMREGIYGDRPVLSDNLSAGTVNTTAAPTQPNAQQQYQTAFDNYKNSTGYQFRLNQGLNAVNSGYAGAGTVKSGAAMKAINDYAQGMASQEFGNYLGALGNQQALGFSAASAQAGVGQNYANNMGNIAMQNGANQANAALVKSQNTANMIGSIANIGGNILGRGF